jgi:hypothetical protein
MITARFGSTTAFIAPPRDCDYVKGYRSARRM